jgi:mannose-6-phosphate isomerase-like protein (cupin superfamily)
VEQDRMRTREPEAGQLDTYEQCVASRKEFVERAYTQRVVVRDEDRPWELTRQARLKFMLMPQAFDDTVLSDWWVFLEDIRTHSGKHRHQGGLVIFVLEGKGHSVIDGERHDWEAGDLILLPLLPDGVEHQHFNADPQAGCKWLAFIYGPYWDQAAAEMVQVEISPEWRQVHGDGDGRSGSQ